MSRKNRIDELMYVEFTYDKDGVKETKEVDVWIPFPVFVNAVRKYFDKSLVNIDGKDNDIWNILVELDCIDNLIDNKAFNECCKEEYKGSTFEQEDYEEWVDDYEFDHNLGKYKDEE